ncbi:hypothetical protein CMV_002886 [Castanea mollissima]|uniref:(S)-2-hydroxy-acid oxidase n=1 Tax=Castanea mollissima TaxID=60419 RepID=A0A8J4W3C5_9ROSI|nr:hypothetical protein CMV_002886 [Castanea mollissima]
MEGEPVNVNEFQELARQALPKMHYDYYTGGAEDQYTLKENVEAFRRITFRPRMLVDVSRIDFSTTVLGYNISAPIMIAPSGLHKLAHPEGEIATARAAAVSNTIMVYKSRDVSAQLVQRAERNGYKAIVLTVDVPRLGRREADIKSKYPKHLIILLLAAIKAVEVGVAGIVVSNHGARQLDYTPATITVLEEVVHAVGGKVPVFLDGGVRRGTDVFKALALGAQAVLIGRPAIYGLAAKGEYGVRKVIQMLKDELELTMALSGCPSVKDITRSHVRTQHEKFHSML